MNPVYYDIMSMFYKDNTNSNSLFIQLAHLNVSDLIFAEIKMIPNTEEFKNMYADGIIGLGYNNLSKIDSNPFFYKLLGDRKILKPIFSVYLNR